MDKFFEANKKLWDAEENKYDFENRQGMLPIQYSIKATK